MRSFDTCELLTAGYPAKPALVIKSGEVVHIETTTHLGGKMVPGATIEDWETWYKEVISETQETYFYPDPETGAKKIKKGAGHHNLTGPVYVEGAKPGDILQVEILDIDPGAYGFNLNPPTDFMKLGILADEYEEGAVRWYSIDSKKKTYDFQPGIEIPVRPFPGTLGVTLPEPGMWSNVPPGRHGGNMDNKELVPGTVLYLPVHTEGGNLKTGDAHIALINKCDITCRCGERFTAEYVSYVFADIDPELKKSILKDHFNCAICPNCGMTFFHEHPFIYRDEANKLWIEVGYPPDATKGKDIPVIQGYYLEGQDNYEQFKVADRTELIAVLFSEDPELRKISYRLDENGPVLITPQKGGIPVALFYEHQGLQLGQRLQASQNNGSSEIWVTNYCTAICVHNLFNSRLKTSDAQTWKVIWQKTKNEASAGIYEDFAVSFADFMTDTNAFSASQPLRTEFFTSLGSEIFNSGNYFVASFEELENAHQAEQEQPGIN